MYRGIEGQIGGAARDRIAGFWRALALEPPAAADHLTVMLAFYAELRGLESAARETQERRRWLHVQQAFLHEHLLTWLPPYLIKLDGLASSFYRGWGRILRQALAEEAARHAEPGATPLHWRRLPPPVDPRRDGAEAFLDFLLAPLASGLILVRSDLERAAGDLGLGLRLGERRFGLKALLGQDARSTLDWLAREATAWSRLLGETPLGAGATAAWADRAAATAALLAAVRGDLPPA